MTKKRKPQPEQEKNIQTRELPSPVEVEPTAEQEVQKSAQEAIQSLEEAAQSAQALGRDAINTPEDEALVRPLDEQIEKTADEAAQQIEQAAAEVLRENWIKSAQAALNRHGYVIDHNEKPYKSFSANHFERFYIQKCFNAEGRAVVAKVGAPNQNTDRHIQRESGLYDTLGDRVHEAETKGEKLKTHFPEKLDFFEEDGQQILVVSYESNDEQAKQELSFEERTTMLSDIIKDMRKLPVPPEELAKPYHERSLNIMRGYEYIHQMAESIGVLKERKVLSSDMAQKLLARVESSLDLISSFPVFFDHGDIHGENIFYTPATQSEEEKVTLIDVESIRLTNEFSPIAQIANRDELMIHYKKKENIFADEGDSFKILLEKLFSFTDSDGKITKSLESNFVEKHERGDEAKTLYHLMRIYETLQTMMTMSGKESESLQKMVQIHKDMLEEQYDKLTHI